MQALDWEDWKECPGACVSDPYAHMHTWPPDLLTQVSDEHREKLPIQGEELEWSRVQAWTPPSVPPQHG